MLIQVINTGRWIEFNDLNKVEFRDGCNGGSYNFDIYDANEMSEFYVLSKSELKLKQLPNPEFFEVSGFYGDSYSFREREACFQLPVHFIDQNVKINLRDILKYNDVYTKEKSNEH